MVNRLDSGGITYGRSLNCERPVLFGVPRTIETAQPHTGRVLVLPSPDITIALADVYPRLTLTFTSS
jgi:hypothetical protein